MEETTLLPLKIEHKGIVYKDKYKEIEKIIATFRGFQKEYFVSNYGRKAALVAVKRGKVLLVRQYRLLINRLSYEIPGGKVNGREDLKKAAVRECLEETGVECGGLKPLIEYDPDLEYSRNHTQVFWASKVKSVRKVEKCYAWVPLEECRDMIFDGRISDSLSILSILAYFVKIGKTRKGGYGK